MVHVMKKLLPLCALLLAGAGQAAQPAVPVKAGDKAIEELARKFGVPVTDVSASPVPGLYEVLTGDRVGYTTADGRYYVRGEMFDMTARQSYTEIRRQQVRREGLASADESKMIVFPAEHHKYTITVFTDVECTYCRKLHSEIAKYNEAGITVRYLAFPREGPKTEDWAKMELVWCAADRRAAITRAKLGEKVEGNCPKAPDIESQYKLGLRMGVQGTPGVFTNDGRMVGGYLSLDKLLALLARPPTPAGVPSGVGQ
jgi:thiol:disulfide interchange protein DsbC